MRTLNDLAKEALSLPVEDRVILAHRVWDSVQHFADADVEKAWMDEADRRWKEIEEGNVQCQPAEEVMRQARQSLDR